jgi:hypothetical protein
MTFCRNCRLRRGVGTVYLVGFWQTYRIAQAIEPVLRRDLKFKQPAVGKNAEVLERIAACPNPVSLHVRRGDYTLAVEGHRTLSMDYYARAIAHFRERLADPFFFICREHGSIHATKRLYSPRNTGTSRRRAITRSCCHPTGPWRSPASLVRAMSAACTARRLIDPRRFTRCGTRSPRTSHSKASH